MTARTRVLALCGIALSLAACGPSGEGDALRDGGAPGDGDAPATAASDPAAMSREAEGIVGFLRDDVEFDHIRLADSVTLRLAPEGGGTRRTVPRAALREPAGWRVEAPSGYVHSLVPFDGPAELTVEPGRHLNCMPGRLDAVAPDLGGMPHVGAMLRPPDATSCLQAWSLTLVFAPGSDPPTLVAAVYDQWEW